MQLDLEVEHTPCYDARAETYSIRYTLVYVYRKLDNLRWDSASYSSYPMLFFWRTDLWLSVIEIMSLHTLNFSPVFLFRLLSYNFQWQSTFQNSHLHIAQMDHLSEKSSCHCCFHVHDSLIFGQHTGLISGIELRDYNEFLRSGVLWSFFDL